MRALSLRTPAAYFTLAALAIAACCAAIRLSALFAASPEVAAWGITFDLTITIPLLYWFLLVRTGRARALGLVPLFLAGVAAAAVIVPRAQQAFLGQLRAVVVPGIEALVVFLIIRRLLALKHVPGAVTDPYERVLLVARAIFGEGRVAEVVASELSVLWYALFCWRKQPEARVHAVTFHQRNGWGTIVACILVLIAAEGLAMHLLLGRWSTTAAWAWTGLDLWGALWLTGDYHAIRLRRSWIEEDVLHLRHGLRWSADIPLDIVSSVREVRHESEWRRRDVLRVAMLDEPRWLVELREPVVVKGLAGMRKEIRALALQPDDEAWVLLLS